MQYQKRKRSALVILKICEALPSILGVRRLEFSHLQKQHAMQLLLIGKLNSAANEAEEILKVQRLSKELGKVYMACSGSAKHLLAEFKTLGNHLSEGQEKELEYFTHFFSNIPDEENFTDEWDAEMNKEINSFHLLKINTANLETALVQMNAGLEVFKEEYDRYLELVRAEKEKGK